MQGTLTPIQADADIERFDDQLLPILEENESVQMTLLDKAISTICKPRNVSAIDTSQLPACLLKQQFAPSKESREQIMGIEGKFRGVLPHERILKIRFFFVGRVRRSCQGTGRICAPIPCTERKFLHEYSGRCPPCVIRDVWVIVGLIFHTNLVLSPQHNVTWRPRFLSSQGREPDGMATYWVPMLLFNLWWPVV